MRTRKQLAAEGIATIENNDYWQYDDANWVLILNDELVDKGFVFKETQTTMWADLKIDRLIEVYKKGIIQIYPLGV